MKLGARRFLYRRAAEAVRVDIRDVTHLASSVCSSRLQDQSRRLACFPGVGIGRLHHPASAEISALAKLGNSGFLGKCRGITKGDQYPFRPRILLENR